MNTDKCKLLVTNHNEDISITIQGETIKGSNSVKLLGVNLDNKLDFNDHVSKICSKVSLKLHAFARISPFMKKKKRKLILKAFIESQFGYCPLVWMFHSRTLNNRINRLHERALRITYKDSLLSFEELLQLDCSFTIHHRNLQRLATEMFKAKNNIGPKFMNEIFPVSKNDHNLRISTDF